jgi:hypothetical protein
MTQHFGRRTSTVFRIAVLGLPLLVAGARRRARALLALRPCLGRRPAGGRSRSPFDTTCMSAAWASTAATATARWSAPQSAGNAVGAELPHLPFPGLGGLATLEPLRTSMALDVPVPWQQRAPAAGLLCLPPRAFTSRRASVARPATAGSIRWRKRSRPRRCPWPGASIATATPPRACARPKVFAMGWIGDGHPRSRVRGSMPGRTRRLTDCSTCHK